MQSIELLWRSVSAQLIDRATLVGLEAQRAWRALLLSLIVALFAALLLAIAWVLLVAAFSVWLQMQGVSLVLVLVLAALLNIAAIAMCGWLIVRNSASISFSASLRAFNIGPSQDEPQSAN